MELRAFLNEQERFTKEEFSLIERAFTKKTIVKGDIIQKVNRFSNKILFIESGLLRVFYLKDGKDITHFFFDENYFIAPIDSIFNNKSERYEWKASENCDVQVIEYPVFIKLLEQIPKLTPIMLAFSMRLLDLFSQKLNILQFEKAFDRYQAFLEMYPNLNNRVSLGDTASFLGITQQTLSVIRAQKA